MLKPVQGISISLILCQFLFCDFFTASIIRKNQKIVLKNLQTDCILHKFKTFSDKNPSSVNF